MKTLGWVEKFGPLGFRIPRLIGSNHIEKCLWCDTDITLQSDSGWEAFTADSVTTQPICKTCDEKSSAEELSKASDDNYESLLH